VKNRGVSIWKKVDVCANHGDQLKTTYRGIIGKTLHELVSVTCHMRVIGTIHNVVTGEKYSGSNKESRT
jgi:hypothetical protein